MPGRSLCSQPSPWRIRPGSAQRRPTNGTWRGYRRRSARQAATQRPPREVCRGTLREACCRTRLCRSRARREGGAHVSSSANWKGRPWHGRTWRAHSLASGFVVTRRDPTYSGLRRAVRRAMAGALHTSVCFRSLASHKYQEIACMYSGMPNADCKPRHPLYIFGSRNSCSLLSFSDVNATRGAMA